MLNVHSGSCQGCVHLASASTDAGRGILRHRTPCFECYCYWNEQGYRRWYMPFGALERLAMQDEELITMLVLPTQGELAQ